MKHDEFYLGQRVKIYDTDDMCNVYGHVTEIEADRICIKWNDIDHGVWHDKDEFPEIKNGNPEKK